LVVFDYFENYEKVVTQLLWFQNFVKVSRIIKIMRKDHYKLKYKNKE